MSEKKNQSWKVNKPVIGVPEASHFTLEDVEYPTIDDGEFVVKSTFISVDPYMRSRIKGGGQAVGGVVGEVVESKNDDFAVGTSVFHYGTWTRYIKSNGSSQTKIRKLNPEHGPLSMSLGILGMPGLTAYVGLLDVAELKDGDTVLVSGAAGAVGSAVGQIAKLKGCKVIGTVGSNEKQEYIKRLGFDVALNYKELDTVEKMSAALTEAAPDGINVYFDNTGGHVTFACFPLLAKFARVAVCGQISMYNDVDTPKTPALLHHLIYKNATVRGFMVYDALKPGRLEDFYRDMPTWIRTGKLKYNETVVEGFESVPTAFINLFSGKNIGKMVVKC